MTAEEQFKLVEDALHFRKIATPGTCFVSNDAATQLRGLDESVLPVIESVIHDSIVPVMEEHCKTHGAVDPNSMFREGPPFPGLCEVLGAYWIIAAETNPMRAREFMRTLPWSVEGEAILAMVVHYNPSRSDVRAEIPAAYCDYILSLRDNQSSDVSRMVTYAIRRLAIATIPT